MWRTTRMLSVPQREGLLSMDDVTSSAEQKRTQKPEEDFFRLLVDRMDEAFARITVDGAILFCNLRLAEMAGLSVQRLLGSSFPSLLPEEERLTFHESLNLSLQQNVRREHRLLRHGKSMLQVGLSLGSFPGEEPGKSICLLATDLTSQKSAFRALDLLRSWNNSLIEASDERNLLQHMCNLLVLIGGYRMVWVGYPENNEKKNVRMVAHSGYQAGYLDELNVSWADDESGQGPTGTAIRTGKPNVCHDTAFDRKFARWRERALARGYRSNLVLPLKIGPKIIGAISIYGAQAGIFDDTESCLLEQMANCLGYGIASLRTKLGKELKAESKAESKSEVR
jgi:PAS domain S-box-containing protein